MGCAWQYSRLCQCGLEINGNLQVCHAYLFNFIAGLGTLVLSPLRAVVKNDLRNQKQSLQPKGNATADIRVSQSFPRG